jgi:hypothetical protein
MKMQNLANHAVKVINSYKTNKVIMQFVEAEAYAQVAKDIAKDGDRVCTPKAAEVLVMTKPNIRARFEEYVNAGLLGCYMQSFQIN